MRNQFIAGVFLLAVASAPLVAQTGTNDLARLAERVAQLEQQVEELSKLVEPMRAQQAVDARRKVLRERFQKKMAQDAAKYSPDQLREAESLYQVANQKWGTAEAMESLHQMIKKFPDINRTGCAMLYVAQKSQGEERTRYLQDCIEKFGDCMYGDGVQVGAYAQFLLAGDCRSRSEDRKAEALLDELKSKFPEAVDHSGNLLTEALKPDRKP